MSINILLSSPELYHTEKKNNTYKTFPLLNTYKYYNNNKNIFTVNDVSFNDNLIETCYLNKITKYINVIGWNYDYPHDII